MGRATDGAVAVAAEAAGKFARLPRGGGFDVFLRDPSTRAGALDGAQLDAVFLRQSAGDGRRLLPLAVRLPARAPDEAEGSLGGGADLRPVVAPTLRVLLPAAFFVRCRRDGGGNGRGLFRLLDVRLGICGVRLR